MPRTAGRHRTRRPRGRARGRRRAGSRVGWRLVGVERRDARTTGDEPGPRCRSGEPRPRCDRCRLGRQLHGGRRPRAGCACDRWSVAFRVDALPPARRRGPRSARAVRRDAQPRRGRDDPPGRGPGPRDVHHRAGRRRGHAARRTPRPARPGCLLRRDPPAARGPADHGHPGGDPDASARARLRMPAGAGGQAARARTGAAVAIRERGGIPPSRRAARAWRSVRA